MHAGKTSMTTGDYNRRMTWNSFISSFYISLSLLSIELKDLKNKEGIFLLEETPFSGVAESKLSESLRETRFYTSGKENGIRVIYDLNNGPLRMTSFVNGKKNGPNITFDYNGKLRHKVNYLEGRKHVVESYFYKGFNKIHYTFTYVRGVKSGYQPPIINQGR